MRLPALIETNRLAIRPYQLSDSAAFLEFMADARATRYLDFDDDQKTPEGAQRLLEYIITTYVTDDPVFALAIVDKETDTFIGSCGLSPLLGEEDGVEVLFSLLPRYWGWGFATEAIAALLYYAFEEAGISRVVANVSEENPKSFRVATNVGMRDEGPHKHERLPKARRFAIDKSMYFEGQRGAP